MSEATLKAIALLAFLAFLEGNAFAGNTATSTSAGNGNLSVITQSGDGNTADVNQNGDDNASTLG